MKLTFNRWGFELLMLSSRRYFCFYLTWATQGFHSFWHDGEHKALNLGPFSFGWGDD